MSIKVSVLMPIYRTQESYLRMAIESILNQTFTNFEFLILDDYPEDDREAIVKSYSDSRIKYVKNEKNLGITLSRNKLIDMAQGEYLAVMDHDDISLPTRFEKQVAYLDSHKNTGVVGCLAETFPNYLDLYHPEKDADIKAALTCRCAILHPASMIRKSVLVENNLKYEERYSPAEDYCLWLRLMECTNFYNIQELLFRYRYHEHNTTSRQIDKMVYAGEELRYLIQKEHPELLQHFLYNLPHHRVFYLYKFPLFAFIKQEQKTTFYLFDKIPVFSVKSKKLPFIKSVKYLRMKNIFKGDFEVSHTILDIFSYQKEVKNTEVWFCHFMGGGADFYFQEQVKSNSSTLYIEVQDLNIKDTLKMSYFYKAFSGFLICNYKDVELLINKISPQKIVVNNLAFSFRLKTVLNLIQRLKNNLNMVVSFRGHDFQAICPNIHMKNGNNKYCGCTDFKKCKTCIKNIKKPLMKIKSISKYRHLWQNFLYNVVDEIIFFSQSSCEIYKKFYPHLENKIKVIPHMITPLRKVNIKEHSEINIAVLGNLSLEKGAKIIKEMDDFINQYSDTNIIVIGDTKEKFEHIRVFGSYKKENLPDIMETNKIDIVFISSIIPETFSYTTAEVMSMGLPISCFNLGAQAEFIKKYPKGLIIDKIDAHYALKKMISFIHQEKGR